MSEQSTAQTKHPIQPLEVDAQGVIRFKQNAIVRYLLDQGDISMNQLAVLEFSREDREQFAQLIGYSHSGAASLDYMSNEVLESAERMKADGLSEADARVRVLEEKLERAREGMLRGVAELFDKHPDDLKAPS